MIRNANFLLPVAVPQDFVRGRFTRNGSCGRTLVTASVKNSASATTPAPLSIREPPVMPLAGASSRFLVSDKADRSSPTVKLPAVKSPHFIYVLKAIKQVMMNVNFASATCPSDRCWRVSCVCSAHARVHKILWTRLWAQLFDDMKQVLLVPEARHRVPVNAGTCKEVSCPKYGVVLTA